MDIHLLNLIRKGDLDAIQTLMCQHPYMRQPEVINSSQDEHDTYLNTAIRFNRFAIVRYLVEECNANVNHIVVPYEPPVMVAINNNQVDILKYIISKGADFQTQVRNSFGTLLVPFLNKYNEIIECLIEHGLPTNDSPNHSYLKMALKFDNDQMALYLINKGVRLQLDAKQHTELYYAAKKGHEQLYQMMIDKQMHVHAYGLNQNDCDLEQIKCLEMLGVKCSDQPDRHLKAIQYWKQSIDLRQAAIKRIRDTNGDPKQVHLYRKQRNDLSFLFDNAIEFSTHEDLERIKRNSDAIRVQGILVSTRLSGLSQPLLDEISKQTHFYLVNHDWNEYFLFFIQIIDLMQRSPKQVNIFKVASQHFQECIDFVLIRYEKDADCRLIRQMVSIFQHGMDYLHQVLHQYHESNQTRWNSNAILMKQVQVFCFMFLPIIAVVYDNLCQLSRNDQYAFCSAVKRLIQVGNIFEEKKTLLHLLCETHCPLDKTCIQKVIPIMICLGADVNAFDANMNTPVPNISNFLNCC